MKTHNNEPKEIGNLASGIQYYSEQMLEANRNGNFTLSMELFSKVMILRKKQIEELRKMVEENRKLVEETIKQIDAKHLSKQSLKLVYNKSMTMA